jgi:t-SNARE complex subunit (syntaxin)
MLTFLAKEKRCMALKPEEITRLETMADEMAKLIEDADNTSSEASVVYGRIGRACVRALANVAAVTAKQAKRDEHVQKFQSARETRKQKKSGAQAQPPESAARPRAPASTTA